MLWLSARYGYIFQPDVIHSQMVEGWLQSAEGVEFVQALEEVEPDQISLLKPAAKFTDGRLSFGLPVWRWSLPISAREIVPAAWLLEGTGREQSGDQEVLRRFDPDGESSSLVPATDRAAMSESIRVAFDQALDDLPEVLANPMDWVGPLDFFYIDS